MSVTPTFRAYVLEQLARTAPDIRDKSMFGGVGIYSGELFFALIAEDTVYFKVDDSNRAMFDAKGMGPFEPYGPGGGSMQYYAVPEEVLEDAEVLQSWVEGAMAVARQKKTRRPRRGTR
ncbi:MAG: TfoX/Sxy family protein [Gemmatimonadota bacterium]|jgi:TfoX/Sxy family transcriptional regulator of competence genes|nr:TfoX/Sxy family protein [Gemmatimonadota bacterium]